jgi:hypothetical protein
VAAQKEAEEKVAAAKKAAEEKAKKQVAAAAAAAAAANDSQSSKSSSSSSSNKVPSDLADMAWFLRPKKKLGRRDWEGSSDTLSSISTLKKSFDEKIRHRKKIRERKFYCPIGTRYTCKQWACIGRKTRRRCRKGTRWNRRKHRCSRKWRGKKDD